MDKNTPEYRTMVKCTPNLETALKDDLTAIAGELQARSIISPENVSALRNSAIDTAERAGKLVEYVTNKVKLSDSYYHLFVEVLMSRQEDNKIILQLLEQTYRDLSGSGGLGTTARTMSEPPMSAASPPSPYTNAHKNRSMSTPEQSCFSDCMNKDDFKRWLYSKGLEKEEDYRVLHDEGVNARCLPRLDGASVKEIASKLSLGGKIIFVDICKEIKENGTPVTSTSVATEPNTSNGSLEVSTDGAESQSHLDQPLKMKDHFGISQRLKDVPNEALVSLGGALGLAHPKLTRMKVLPGDLVAAWLRKEDEVLECGRPTRRVLANALSAIGQNGVADSILRDNTPV